MMENAGRSLASVCMTMLGARWAGRPVAVVAGTGGNGGGGICAARHLANHGADVTLVVSDSRRSMADDLIGWMSNVTAPVVALDVPSGIDASTGHTPGSHVRATTPVTLALPKTGLHVDAVGELWVADIGIPPGVFERAGTECHQQDSFHRDTPCV